MAKKLVSAGAGMTPASPVSSIGLPSAADTGPNETTTGAPDFTDRDGSHPASNAIPSPPRAVMHAPARWRIIGSGIINLVSLPGRETSRFIEGSLRNPRLTNSRTRTPVLAAQSMVHGHSRPV